MNLYSLKYIVCQTTQGLQVILKEHITLITFILFFQIKF